MRASATIRRELFAAPVRLYRSTRRVLRFLQAGRALLLLFAVLVTLNLTLICQGHLTGNGYTGPHVTLLFGIFHVHSVSPAEPAHSAHAHSGHTAHALAPQPAPQSVHPVSKTALYSAGANTVGASQTAQADAFGLSALSWVSLLLFVPAVGLRRRLPRLAEELLKSQVESSPDSPPPRLSF